MAGKGNLLSREHRVMDSWKIEREEVSNSTHYLKNIEGHVKTWKEVSK